MLERPPFQMHVPDLPGRCMCIGYGPYVGMLVGQFAQVASIATGKPKEDFFVCGSALHEFIEVFKLKLAQGGQEGFDMPVYVDAGSSQKFEPHPEGLHRAVCAQVIDLGLQQTQWGEKRKVDLKFQLADDNLRTDGKRFTIGRRYTASLNERANLRKELEMWRGKKFTAAELAKFDLDTLVGINCQLQLVHTAADDGRVYANIQAILPPAKGEPKLEVKVEDIPKPKDVTFGGVTGPAVDQDVPF